MDRYQRENAVRLVSGYYLPRPHEAALQKQTETFARAKCECAAALRAQVAAIESLTSGDFFEEQRRANSSAQNGVSKHGR